MWNCQAVKVKIVGLLAFGTRAGIGKVSCRAQKRQESLPDLVCHLILQPDEILARRREARLP